MIFLASGSIVSVFKMGIVSTGRFFSVTSFCSPGLRQMKMNSGQALSFPSVLSEV